MGCSVYFTIDEINTFISSLGNVTSAIGSSKNSIESAVNSTITRLNTIIRQLEAQLREIQNDMYACEEARYVAKQAMNEAENELDRINAEFAKMSQEEQSANASVKTAAQNRYKAMKQIYDTLNSLYRSLRTKADSVSSSIYDLQGKIREIEKVHANYEKSANACWRAINDVSNAARGAKKYAERAVSELTEGLGYVNVSSLRIWISDTSAFSMFANTARENISQISDAVNDLANSSALAEATLQDAVMSASGLKISDVRTVSEESISRLREYRGKISRAYTALEGYTGYSNLSVG